MSKKDQIPQVYYDSRMEAIVILPPEQKKMSIGPRQRLDDGAISVVDYGLVSIIILCWNHLKYTRVCIDSIRANTSCKYQLVLVDNGSTDGTAKYMESILRDDDVMIRSNRNVGFSSGNNLGAKIAVGEYLCFLNNDCEVRANWLDDLIDGLRAAGLVGASMCQVRPDDRARVVSYDGVAAGVGPFSYLEGFCLLTRKKDFFSIGGFDTQFDPFLCEDSDLSFRFVEAGLGIKQVETNAVLHHVSKSIKDHPDRLQVGVENRMRLYSKWIATGRLKAKVPKRILVRRAGAVGDVLLTTPILRELKRKHPNSYIVYETACPEVLFRNPYVDEIVTACRGDGFDLTYNLSYERAGHGNYINEMAQCAGVDVSDKSLVFSVSEEALRWVRGFVSGSSGKYACVHTGKTWKSREWPLDKFNEVMRYLVDKKYDVLELGDRGTSYGGIGKDCRGISIQQSSALLQMSRVFVGIDSLCVHLAAAVGTPAVVIYGCTLPEVVWSAGPHYPVYADVSCRGCRHRAGGTFVDCSTKSYDCLKNIDVGMVIGAVEKCLTEVCGGRGE